MMLGKADVKISANQRGFTLVELLVVIVILGILMAMMVPAAGLILERASKATAKADADVVVTVMVKYQTEYNRWPNFYFDEDAPHLTDNVWVQAMSPSPGGKPSPSNLKRILFFEAGAGALDETTGAFVDPWKQQPYEYALDLDGDGTVANPETASATATIPGRAIAWSAGPDKDLTTWADNVKSWE